MEWPHDPDLPAGVQDADLDMLALEAAGRRARALQAAGRCPHGWIGGHPTVECYNCGATGTRSDPTGPITWHTNGKGKA